MRISGGRLKGVRLARAGTGIGRHQLRPTLGRIRSAIFDMLIHSRLGNRVERAQVLDLFAGTGAMGFEALSRGAASTVFVETSGPACALIRRNIELLGVASCTSVCRCDATALPPPRHPPGNLVFVDPPYGKGLAPAALDAALARNWVEPGCIVVVEEAELMPVDGPIEIINHRCYGSTCISIGMLRPPAAA